MNCREFESQIMLFAAGALPGDEARELSAHLATGCPWCQQVLRESTCAVQSLLDQIPAEQPPAYLRDELLRRTGAHRAANVSDALAGSLQTTRPTRYLRTGIWSAVAGATAMTLLVHFLIGRPLSYQLAQLRQGFMNQQLQIQDLLGQVRFASSKIQELQSPYLMQINLERAPTAGDDFADTSGYVLWDSLAHQFHCYLFDLPLDEAVQGDGLPESPQRHYVVWLETMSGRLYLAGELATTSHGTAQDASALLNGTEETRALKALQVTLEDTATPDQPGPRVIFRRELVETS